MVVNELRSARAEKRLTQADVARLVGVSRQTVASIEAGGSVPSVAVALRLARTLGRPVESLFRLGAGGASRALVIAGSDDPGLALLVERLRQSEGPLLSLSPLGSTAGLESVAAGAADIAGIHLGDNLADAMEALRDPALIHFARREQGLLLGPRVRMSGLRDLARQRVILRPRGSGTRALFERSASSFGGRVVAEAPTHDQIAAAVLRGDADVGTSLRATARRYGLRFFRLAWERFDLVLERSLLADDRVTRLVTALRDREHRDAIEALRGYDLRDAGLVTAR